MKLFRRPFASAAVAFAFGSLASGIAPAATPAPAHPLHLVKLPNGDYTIPMSELESSGMSGTVTLHPSGPKTIVRVKVFGPPKHLLAFHLHSGSDCTATAADTAVALRPAFGGQQSQTLVSVPISDFASKDYVVDAHDATEKRQFAEACAHLR